MVEKRQIQSNYSLFKTTQASVDKEIIEIIEMF